MNNSFSPAKILFAFGFLITFAGRSSAQCPTSNFYVNSPVCAGIPLQIANYSSGASSFAWDFSPGYFSGSASLASDTLLPLNYPGDITLVTENDTNIVFISGYGDGKLHRAIYGNGPENPITSYENLGNIGVLYQPTDIALYKQGSTWYGLIVDFGSNYLFRIRFGNSLKNTPDSAVTVLNNTASQFSSPASIKLVMDSTGVIYGIVSNYGGGSISILDFGNSILNTPTVTAPIMIGGTSFAQDAILAKSCGNWHAFIAGTSSTKIFRADFGNSLTNTPTFTTIVNSGAPSDLLLIQDSSHWKLLCTDFNNFSIRKFDLGTDLTNNTPTAIGSDYFAGQYPKGICSTRKGNTQYIHALYSTHNLQVMRYTNNVNVSKAFSTDTVPADIVYTQSGTYPITLFVQDANGNNSTFTDTIVVTPAPNTAFMVTNMCFGDNTLFNDQSTINSGNVASWDWDFNDGFTSTMQSPNHTYQDTGTYQVQLITSSTFGCFDTLTTQIAITPKPVATFASPSPICSNTLTQLTDQSTVAAGTISTWHWEYGNGDTSNVQDPLYSFPSFGNYQVQLIAWSDAGCSDTASSTIAIDDRPMAAFTASNTCVGQNVQFSDQSTIGNSSITSYAWNFGDGNYDTAASPTHLYGPGVNTYQSELIVTAANGCADTLQKPIKVNNIPTVDFSSAPTSACQNNDIIFTDLSTVAGDTISSWLWDFGDGTYDSIANPVHQYSSAGLKTVTLISFSPSNCAGVQVSRNIDVKESPIAAFTTTNTCQGNEMYFLNNSIPAPGSTIDSVLWTFNTNDSSNLYSPDFLFPGAGFYPVTLLVISPEGCLGSDSMMVQIHSEPVANFSYTTPCTGDSVNFTNSSTCDSLSSFGQYEWNFGDFSSGANNFSFIPNPAHKYNTTNPYTVALISTTNFGCKDTVYKTFTVNQSPPAQFSYSPTCYGDLMEFFNPGSSLDSAYLWNFGDSQTNQQREPAHFYAFPGTYTVKLHVIGRSGCSNDATKQVSVSPIPTADFIANPACLNTPYTFQDNSSIASGSISSWSWSITSLTPPASVQNPVYTFTTTGNYNVTMTITSDIGCSKSVTKAVGVHDLPVSNFSFDPEFGNPPLLIQTTDHSTGGAYYQWDFGDGSDVENLHEPAHMYVDTGLYNIKQIVMSQYGCLDSLVKQIYVIHPVLDIVVTGDSSYYEGEYFHVVGRIENHGTREITSLNMEARLENGNTIREELNTVIPNGPTGFLTYPFHASFLINSGSEFNYYCISANDPNGQPDNFPENNERCFNLTEEMIVMDPYPNPFLEKIYLRLLLPSAEIITLELTDMNGKTVRKIYEGKAPKNLFEITEDLSDIPDGMYAVKLYYRDKIIGNRVVKNSRGK